MQVSFKGIYAIPGSTILNNSVAKNAKFFDATKSYRTKEDCSYMDGDTFDYYVNVKDEKEKAFEHAAQKFKIPVIKKDVQAGFIPVVRNGAHTRLEIDSLLEVISECMKEKA